MDGIHHVGGDHGIDDVLLDLGAQLFGGNLVVVLGGNHDGVDALGLAVDVLDADLALAVGTQEIELAGAPHFAQLANQLVGQHDRQRHQLRGFVAGVAEHQALVAGAAGIDAHGDVGRLALDGVEDAAGLAVEAEAGVGVADVVDHAAHQARHVDVGIGGDFARNHADSGGDQDLAGHAARGIVFQNRVQDGIRNLVRHLVGMSFGNRLRRKNMPHFF